MFTSTKGLVMLVMVMITLVTAIWGTLSGPMAEWGVKDLTVKLLGMDLDWHYREGRIIILYHSIAMAFVALEVYCITSIVKMSKVEQSYINAIVTFGYLTVMIFGLAFAYFGRNFAFHGLFLVGQSLVFFSGILLAKALWPWQEQYRITDRQYASTKKGLDLERTAFFVMAVATLGSAMFGAVAGAFWGNGHETFLAEDLIRTPHKTYLQKAVIGHLHIMLVLICVAVTLIVGRWLDFKGILHKIAMHFMIWGTIIISFGAWSVVWVHWAHTTIYVGSVLVMLAALMYVIYSWKKLINDRIEELKIEKPTLGQKIKALLHDPLKFGSGWQMVFMNFTVSGIGIFLAIKLDEIFRAWPFREERITLTGHWHILAALCATIMIMYYADVCGLKGRIRQWFGWTLIICSDVAFAAMTIFSMKRLFISEYDQQNLVDTLFIIADLGLGALLTLTVMLFIWRLSDLLKPKGKWRDEADNPELDVKRIS